MKLKGLSDLRKTYNSAAIQVQRILRKFIKSKKEKAEAILLERSK